LRNWQEVEDNNPLKDPKKMLSYEIALNEIATYSRIRRRNLLNKRKGPGGRGDFNTEQAKMYDVVLGLGRHLGMDMGFFRPIEDQMFDMNKDVKSKFKALGKKLWIFIRHHFRNNPDRTSIAITDEVLIDSRSHTFWEAMMSEDDSRIATEVLEELIAKNGPITEVDIRNAFAKKGSQYSWIMRNWVNQRNFATNLATFNLRKSDIKSMNIMDFIQEHYPKAYTKFITVLLKKEFVHVRDIIQAMHPTVDISALVGVNDNYINQYSTVFSEILKMYNYPVY